VVIKDWARLFPKEMLYLLARSKPALFASHATNSLFINLYHVKIHTRLHEMMTKNEFNLRRTEQTYFYDSSRKRIGRQAIGNETG